MKHAKKEKRSHRHGALLAKIHKNPPSKPSSARQSKNPKHIANLQALADALPDLDPDRHQPQASSSNSINVIRHKTLRHKPGAQKRRQQLEKLERDRFASNMAQMAPRHQTTDSAAAPNAPDAPDGTESSAAGTANRWAALRNFISQTMDQQPGCHGQRQC